MPEEQDEMLQSKATLQEKLIKQDITLRIAEAVNNSGLVQRGLYFGDVDIQAAWANFIESFIKLHKMTMHIIDNDGKIQTFFKNLNTRGYCINGIMKIDAAFKKTDDEVMKGKLSKQKEQLLKMVNATSPHKSLELFDELMGRLQEAGLLDILTVQMMPNFFFKRPEPVKELEPVEEIPSVEDISKPIEPPEEDTAIDSELDEVSVLDKNGVESVKEKKEKDLPSTIG